MARSEECLRPASVGFGRKIETLTFESAYVTGSRVTHVFSPLSFGLNFDVFSQGVLHYEFIN